MFVFLKVVFKKLFFYVYLLLKKLINEKYFSINEKYFRVNGKYFLINEKYFSQRKIWLGFQKSGF